MRVNRRRQISLELIREAIQRRGCFRFSVEGSSMFPFLIEGDEVFIEKVEPEDLRVGDIIAYSRGDMLIVHRIKEIYQAMDRRLFITQGDNLTFQDAPLLKENIIGRVDVVVRGNKRFRAAALRPEVICLFRRIIDLLRRLKKRLNLSINQQDIINYLRGD